MKYFIGLTLAVILGWCIGATIHPAQATYSTTMTGRGMEVVGELPSINNKGYTYEKMHDGVSSNTCYSLFSTGIGVSISCVADK